MSEDQGIYGSENIVVGIGDLNVVFVYGKRLLEPRKSWNTDLHFHTMYEFHYIAKGGALLSRENGTSVELGEGGVCVIAPGAMHRIKQLGGSVEYCTVNFSIARNRERPDGFSEYEYYSSALESIGGIRCARSSDCPELLTYMKAAAEASGDNPDRARHKLKIYLAAFFIASCGLLCENPGEKSDVYPETEVSDVENESRRWKIDGFIAENYSRDIMLEDLAPILHLSERQTGRVIKKLTGYGLRELLLRQRMSIAKLLMRSEGLTLEDVAARAGYCSYSGFYNAVKRYYGVTPEELKLLYKGKAASNADI